MAYPTIDGPYGLRPVNLIGGQVFAGATRQRRIYSSSASSIGFGDPVKFDSNGCIVVCTETSTAPTTGFAGVFMGCTFVSSVTGQPTFSQAWIANTSVASNTNIIAYVCEDPDQLFQVCGVSGTTVVSTTSGFTYADIWLKRGIGGKHPEHDNQRFALCGIDHGRSNNPDFANANSRCSA